MKIRILYPSILFLLFAVIMGCGQKKNASEEPVLQKADSVSAPGADTSALRKEATEIKTGDNENPKEENTSGGAGSNPGINIKADITGTGTMVKKGTDIWVIRTTGPDGTDYLPSNLKSQFKTEGIEVSFKANLEPIPPGVRLAGKPISIVTIRKI